MFCGLGGLSGSLGAKLFSSVAQAKGTADVVLAATPFSAESLRRRELATKILKDILSTCTLCVEFDNDKLSSLAPNLPITRAFSLMKSIMLRPVMDACSAMTRMDVGVLRHVLSDANYGRFGLGLARGDDRVRKVVDEALSSPWFDFPLAQVSAAVAVYSSSDPWDKEAETISGELCARLSSARIAWGSYADPSLKDRIRLSLVICRSLA
jgi:cell division GTPase FtsZ